MSRERLKNCNNKKSLDGNENDSTEVFVLSPNILQKLGIDLGNVEVQPQECSVPSETSISHCNVNNQLSFKNEPSMLQTADLMKKSVLLSPTFDSVADELDLPNDVDFMKSNLSNGCHSNLFEVDDCHNAEGNDNNLDFFHTLDENEPIQQIPLPKELPDQIQGQDNNTNFIPKAYSNDSEVSVSLHTKITKVNSCEVDSDEFIKSKNLNAANNDNKDIDNGCLVSQFSVTDDVIESNAYITSLNANKVQMESKEKNNLTTEALHDNMTQHEILLKDTTPTEIQLESIDSLTTQDVAKVLETISSNFLEINTTVMDSSTDVISVSDNKLANELLFKPKGSLQHSSSETIGKQLNKRIANAKLHRVKSTTVDYNLNSNDVKNNSSEQSLKCLDTSLSLKHKIRITTKIRPTETNELKQVLKTYSRKKTYNTGSSKSDTSDKVKSSNNNTPTFQSASIDVFKALNAGSGTPKLCIQGVEKPGGITTIHGNKYFRTYKRNKFNNSNLINTVSAIQNKLDELRERKYEQGNIDCNEENVDAYEETGENFLTCYKIGEYCLCNDFGALNFYENNDTYEHIHFWASENIQCDMSIIYSIYEDFENFVIKHYDFDMEIQCKDNYGKETLEPCTVSSCPEDNKYQKNLTVLEDTSYNNCTTKDYNEDKLMDLDIEPLQSDVQAKKRTIPTVGEGSKRKKRATIQLPSENRREYDGSVVTLDEISSKSKKTGDLNSYSNVEMANAKFNVTSYSNAEKANTNFKVISYSNAEKAKANFNVTSYSNAEKPNANFNVTSYSNAEKPNANLNVTSYSNAEKANVNLNVTSYSNAEKANANFNVTSYSNAEKANANLNVTSYSNAEKANANLNMTSYSNAEKAKANFNVTSYSNAEKPNANFNVTSYSNAEKANANLNLTSYSNAEKTNANLNVTSYSNAEKANANFNVTSYSNAEKANANFNLTSYSNAEKANANFNLTSYSNAEKANANFNLTSYSNAEKANANFNVTSYSNAEKANANFNSLNNGSESNIEVIDIEMNHVQALTDSNITLVTHACEENTSSASYVTCGVCANKIAAEAWTSHMGEVHDYLAWKDTDTPLNLEDEKQVSHHLTNTAKLMGGLVCSKCGSKRKYGKSFMQHLKNCTDEALEDGVNKTKGEQNNAKKEDDKTVSEIFSNESIIFERKYKKTYGRNHTKVDDGVVQRDSMKVTKVDPPKSENVTPSETGPINSVVCGVCKEEMDASLWYLHVAKTHDYLAWKNTETPLDLKNDEALYHYLTEVSKLIGGLICNKCGLKRKYGKKFLLHVRSCTGDKLQDTLVEDDTTVNISSTEPNVDESSSSPSKSESASVVKCGVCDEIVEAALWTAHMGQRHNYIAWKHSDTSLDLNDEEALYRHLTVTSKQVGGLICNKCAMKRKYGKAFLQHVRICTGEAVDHRKDDSINTSCTEQNHDESSKVAGDINESASSNRDSTSVVTCGVCGEKVDSEFWTTHIGNAHQYIAWKDSEAPLDLKNKEAVCNKLTETAKQIGGLVCNKCGLKRKYGKPFLQHVRKCTGKSENQIKEDTLSTSCTELNHDESFKHSVERESENVEAALLTANLGTNHDSLARKENVPSVPSSEITAIQCYEKTVSENLNDDSKKGNAESPVTCGVCTEQIQPKQWMHHIALKHDYLAWKEGGTSLDFNDNEIKNQYLKELCKKLGTLACSKCGLERRYVKSYLNHINACMFEGSALHSFNDKSSSDVDQKLLPSSSGEVVCGVCLKKTTSDSWVKHKMEEHYNLAWFIGQTPIDFKNNYAIEKILKEYKEKYNALVCKNCKTSRVSGIGFFTHILTCGKSEEEIEACKMKCERCDKKYFYVYNSHHLKWHAEQDYKDQIKKEKEDKIKLEEIEEEADETGGRSRKAARKAIAVISKYKSEESEHKYVCETCGFGTNNKMEFGSHNCKSEDYDFSDSGESAQIEDEDESSGDDEDEETDVSEEEPSADVEVKVTKRRRCHISGHKMAKMRRMPFQIEEPEKYLLKSGEQYMKYHLSEKDLYPEWRQETYEITSDEEVTDCLPALQNSCKLKINPGDWTTLKRFEVQYNKQVSTLFVGASIESACWVPGGGEGGGSFLAVVCRPGTDAPRLQPHCLHKRPGIIQIWDFAHFDQAPKLALSLVHTVGTVWGARWCPGGARDRTPARAAPRLGLLALASSQGSAYIFSVPYPPHNASDKLIYKITPVVELRLSMNNERKQYQATSLDWSPEKGHKVIVVGYADGTTAYFDLTIDSPLLRRKENNVTVLYPYHDERMLNSCVTDVSLCAGLEGSGYGAVAAASPTMGVMGARRGARGLAVTGRLAAHHVAFMPHWPTALFAGDEAIGVGTAHEVEWWGGARRVCWSARRAACPRCAALAAAAPPHVALLHPHPAHDFINRKMLCSIDMVPLAKKRKKFAKDNLGIRVEPNTYEDAVKKYGVEFKWTKDPGGPMPMEDPNVGRFPLCEVVSLDFCPAAAHHHKLAIATHAGLIFVIDSR